MRLPCSAAAAAALALACHAQKTDTPPTAYDEVITLEEFYVGAAAPDSYIVSESMGGTRTGAKILETPSMVQVITSEFMEDFQTLDDYNDLPMIASYTPEGDDGRGGAPGRLRGFSPIKMRDGFPRTVLPTLANTKQAEAIMGPQSALYGQASPGGIINYVSKRPSATTRRYLTLAAGSNDYRRAELELSGPFVPGKLFYLSDFYHGFARSDTAFQETKTTSYALNVLYKLNASTAFSVNWEQQFQTYLQGTGAPHLITGSRQRSSAYPSLFDRTGGTDAGYVKNLAGFNVLGPNQDHESRWDSLTLVAEHRLNRHWSTRLNLIYYYRMWTDENFTGGSNFYADLLPDGSASGTPGSPGTLPGRYSDRYIYTRDYDVSDFAVQSETLWQPLLFGAPQKVLFALDYTRDYYHNRMGYAEDDNQGDWSRYGLNPNIRFIDPANPYWGAYPDYSQATRVGNNTRRTYDYAGATASWRGFWLKNKLISSASARYVYTNAYINSSEGGIYIGKSHEDAVTWSAGLNYKILGDSLTAYAGASTSYEPVKTFDEGLGVPLPAERGRGFELGLKGEFPKLNAGYTLSLFDIRKTNVREINPDYVRAGEGIAHYTMDGEQHIPGIEFAGGFSPVKGLNLAARLALLDSKVTRGATKPGQPDSKGKRPLYTSDYMWKLEADYRFPGSLKGFKIGLLASWQSECYSWYERVPTSPTSGDTIRDDYVTPSLFLLSGFLSYEFRGPGKFSHNIRLNIRNLLDHDYLTAGGSLGAPRAFILTYRLSR